LLAGHAPVSETLVVIENYGMRIIFIFFLTIISFNCKADFTDKVDVYVNGKLVTSTENFTNGPYLFVDTLKVGDTIMFYAQTDWDELFSATLDISDTNGNIIGKLNRIPNNKYGAQFQLIVTEEYLKLELEITLNYNENSKIDPWQFITMKKRGG
jgi:hypothetical protein